MKHNLSCAQRQGNENPSFGHAQRPTDGLIEPPFPSGREEKYDSLSVALEPRKVLFLFSLSYSKLLFARWRCSILVWGGFSVEALLCIYRRPWYLALQCSYCTYKIMCKIFKIFPRFWLFHMIIELFCAHRMLTTMLGVRKGSFVRPIYCWHVVFIKIVAVRYV